MQAPPYLETEVLQNTKTSHHKGTKVTKSILCPSLEVTFVLFAGQLSLLGPRQSLVTVNGSFLGCCLGERTGTAEYPGLDRFVSRPQKTASTP